MKSINVRREWAKFMAQVEEEHGARTERHTHVPQPEPTSWVGVIECHRGSGRPAGTRVIPADSWEWENGLITVNWVVCGPARNTREEAQRDAEEYWNNTTVLIDGWVYFK